ncbi:hypothetical protein INT45_009798 [Circinella minor]|uniref:Uncharacterized protein n=1 Tax=Circinella minor TaxID=1195481 RepID=A0A8H7RGT0_9FUNG|nr:hypothetical protein INT45_009798 [Circinella minor]
MPQTTSNSEIERVQNDTFRPQLPLKYGGRKLGEWNIFVFYASLEADDAHPEYEASKRNIRLPEGFKWKSTSDRELKRIFSSRIGTEAGEFIAERTAIENLRRELSPTNDHDRKEVEDLLVGQLLQILGAFKEKLDVDAAALLYSKKRNAFGNQLQYHNSDAAGRALIGQGLGGQFHRHIAKSKTDRELKKFPWSEFKLTVSDVYPDKHYYYHNGEKLAIVGFDYGVDHKTGSHYKTAVRPKDLLAEKQQQLEKGIEDNSIYLVKEEEILQFLLLCAT